MAKQFNLKEYLEGFKQTYPDATPEQARWGATNFLNTKGEELYGSTKAVNLRKKQLQSTISTHQQRYGKPPTAKQVADYQKGIENINRQQLEEAKLLASKQYGFNPISKETQAVYNKPVTNDPWVNAGVAFKRGAFGNDPMVQQPLGGNNIANTVASLGGSALRGLAVGNIGRLAGATSGGAIGSVVPVVGTATGALLGGIAGASIASGTDSALQNIEQQKQAIYMGKQPTVSTASAIGQGAFDALPLQFLKPLQNLGVVKDTAVEGLQEGASQVVANTLNPYNKDPLEGVADSLAGGAGVGLGMNLAKAILGKYGRNANTATALTPEQEVVELGTAIYEIGSLPKEAQQLTLDEIAKRYGTDAAYDLDVALGISEGTAPIKDGRYQGEVSIDENLQQAQTLANIPDATMPSAGLNALAGASDALTQLANVLPQPSTQTTHLPNEETNVAPQAILPPPTIGDVSQQQTEEVSTVPIEQQQTEGISQLDQLIQQLQALPLDQQQGLLSQLSQQLPNIQQNQSLPQDTSTPTLPPTQTEALQGQQTASNPEPQAPLASVEPPQVQTPTNETTQGFKGAIQQTFGLNNEQAESVARVYEETNRTMAERNAITPQEQAQRFEFVKTTPEQLQGQELKQEQNEQPPKQDFSNINNIEFTKSQQKRMDENQQTPRPLDVKKLVADIKKKHNYINKSRYITAKKTEKKKAVEFLVSSAIQNASENNLKQKNIVADLTQKQTYTAPANAKQFLKNSVVKHVMYHGTPDANFTSFSPDFSRAGQSKHQAIFFSSSARVASDYSKEASFDGTAKTQGAVFPVLLNLQNPLVINAKGKSYRQLDADKNGNIKLPEDFVAEAKAQGHDGVIFEDMQDPAGKESLGIIADTIAVFEPTQIKSIFNVGTFDTNNPDIRFQQALSKPLGAFQQKDQQLIIYALTNPNVSTPLHELAHAYESVLNSLERKTVLNYAKQKTWNRATSEAFAEGFEAYLAEGNAPIKGLEAVFKKFKTWLTSIYNAIQGSPLERELTDEMRSIYDVMLGGKPANVAKVAKVYDNEGNSYDTQYDVVEAKDLITSNNDDYTINAKYPKELQPRDRQRMASKDQVDSIARKLTPAKLAESNNISDGSPIVGSDNVVESGNGRTLALRRAYTLYPDKANEYKQYIRDNSDSLGINTSKLDTLKEPVLVRRRTTDTDRVAFSKRANESNLQELSSLEQAKNDASKIKPETMALLEINKDGEVNAEFLIEFLDDVVASNERSSMIAQRGDLTKKGVERIRHAILAKVFNEPKSQQMLAKMLDASSEETVGNIGKAILGTAPTMASFQAGVKAKQFFDLNIAKNIATASAKYLELKEAGQAISDYMRQQQLISDGLTDFDKRLLNMLDEYKRKPAQLENVLKNYYSLARGEGNPEQQGLFPVDPATPTELLDKAEAMQIASVLHGLTTDVIESKLKELSDAQQKLVERMLNCG